MIKEEEIFQETKKDFIRAVISIGK